MPDALVGYVSVESRLELVPPIGSDRVSPERELLGDVANEVDGVGLRVAAVDLQRANSCIIIDGRVRVPPHRRPLLLPQSQEFYVYLYRVWPGTLALNWSTQQPHRYVCWTSKVERLARMLIQSKSGPIQIRLREGLHRGYTSI